MKNLCLIFFSFTLLFSVVASPLVYAAELSLTSIGSLDTSGKVYSEWWYTGINVTLSGTAGSGADVIIMVDDTKITTKADASGNWFVATTTPKGDYQIDVTSGSEAYSFILHTGQDVPSSSGGTSVGESATPESTASVPATGYSQIAGILASVMFVSTGLMIYLNGRNNKKSYVKSILKTLD